MNSIPVSSPAGASSSTISFSATNRTQNYETLSVANYTPVLQFLPQFCLFGRIALGWDVIRPLLISLEQDENGDYIAHDNEFFVYGSGKTAPLAQKDYVVSLIEYYTILERQEDSPTQLLFRYLQSYISRINS